MSMQDEEMKKRLGISGKNLMPDYVIETFFKQIKKRIEDSEDYSEYISLLKDLNGSIPKNIQELIDKNKK